MTDDEIERALRAARPGTGADDGWAGTEEGEEALAAIHLATTAPAGSNASRLRRVRPFGLGIGLTAAAAVVVTIGLAMNGPAHAPIQGAPPPSSPAPAPVGAVPEHMTLAAYSTCDALVSGLRAHTAAHVTADGLDTGGGSYFHGVAVDDKGLRLPVATADAAAGNAASTPDHSTTNDQEIGVDEPDLVKTDGRRVVAISNGVLRVVDAATRKVTGTLDLGMYAGGDSAQLMLEGDRVLVLLGSNSGGIRYGGPIDYGPRVAASAGGSTFLLVDIAGAPTVVSTLHSNAGYVDARLVGGEVRVVAASTPRLTFPVPADNRTTKQRVAANRHVVQSAPLSAWLPSYQTTHDGVATTHTVPCSRVSHPAKYTGESMLTVFSFDLAASLDDARPISIAADGATVYASTSSLYVSSSDGSSTDLHRFFVGDPGTPRYLGSGRVPGALFDSYSMSEYDGALRVVTTQYKTRQVTSVYVLDADTLRRTGSVGGLGAGENLHAVRFLGPLAYVVTYESVDPLYVLDLHDPAHPRRAGELKVTGYSDYLHPTDAGRLLGIGQSVDNQQRVTGLQVSLFDVSDGNSPSRIARLIRSHTPSETPIDPHAFLYWAATRTAVLPIDSWEPSQSGAALVLHVGRNDLRTIGTIRNPAVNTVESYDSGIVRTLVIGDTIWTMSSSGLQVSDLQSLARRAWVPFS